ILPHPFYHFSVYNGEERNWGIQMEDRELIKRIQEGDNQAIITLHNRYADRIFHYIYMQTGSYHDAEELLQDVFFKAAKNLNQFKGKSTFKTWVFKIARHTIIDYYRGSAKEKDTITVEVEKFDFIGQYVDSAEDKALSRIQVNEVLKYIEELPLQYQSVLHLRFFEGFTVKETSDIMGKSVLAVKSMQHRARAALNIKMKWEVYDA
ncbi:RNA polymerase sigma factor, partial [Virgibacillus oceani]